MLLGGHLLRGIVGRDHEALDGGVFDEVDDAQLERDGRAPVVAEELDPDGDGMGGGGAACRLAQGRHEQPAVGLSHDVGERAHLNELGVMAQQAGDSSRSGLEKPGGGHQHDDGPDVVHQRPELGLAAAGQLEATALGQVAQAEQHEVLARETQGSPDDFDQAPPGDRFDADLNRVTDVLVLNGGERAEHELLVVRVHQAQPGDADGVGQ